MQYTIARVISSKPVEGKYGPQFSVFFTTNETGEQGVSTFSKYELKPGQQIEGEITQKPGTNKAGEEVTYHNFSFTKKGGFSDGERKLLQETLNLARETANKLTTLTLRHDKLVNHLIEKGIVPQPVMNVPGTNVEIPPSQGPTAFDEEFEIDPADIPFN